MFNLFNLFKKQQKHILIPYSYAMKVRKKYAEFVEDKTWNTDTIWIREKYDENKPNLNIMSQVVTRVLNTRDDIYKELNKTMSGLEIIIACLDDSYIDWDNMTSKDCKALKYDNEIIAACMSFLAQFRAILSNTDKESEQERFRCLDYCTSGCELIAYKFGIKGEEFVNIWGCSDGTIGLVDYCVKKLNEQAVNAEVD